MHNMMQQLLSVAKMMLVPSFCVSCKEWLSDNTIFCSSCKALIQPVVSTMVEITPTKVMSVFAVGAYQEPLKSLILAKSRSDYLASKQSGQLLWELTPMRTCSFDYIVPIPLHWRRYAYRGYNQATVMAQELSKRSKKPMVELLSRTKNTVFQSSLPIDERSGNVKDIFVAKNVDVHPYYGKHIILVDDLMTTGATLRAAAKSILALRPAAVSAVVLCRTI